MTFLSWRTDYGVDFPQIDSEHQNLFDLINEFHDKCASGDPHPDSANVLNKLVAYAEEHFKHEEVLMEANAYPRLEHHREQHAVLFTAIFKLHERFAANPSALDAGTRNFLQHWLLDHILKDDMDFRDFRIHQSEQAARAAGKEVVPDAETPVEKTGDTMTAAA
jgi:hemerythrin